MPDHCKFKLSPNLFFRQETNKFHHCAGLSMSKRMIHVAERRLVNFYFIFSIFLFCLLWKKEDGQLQLAFSFHLSYSSHSFLAEVGYLISSSGNSRCCAFNELSIALKTLVDKFQHSENCTACGHGAMKMAYVASIGDSPASTTDFF